MPPYLLFQLYRVASETPCLRARSAVFAPASCSRKTEFLTNPVLMRRACLHSKFYSAQNAER